MGPNGPSRCRQEISNFVARKETSRARMEYPYDKRDDPTNRSAPIWLSNTLHGFRHSCGPQSPAIGSSNGVNPSRISPLSPGLLRCPLLIGHFVPTRGTGSARTPFCRRRTLPCNSFIIGHLAVKSNENGGTRGTWQSTQAIRPRFYSHMKGNFLKAQSLRPNARSLAAR